MTNTRLAYDDASSAQEMYSDCRAVEDALQLPQRRTQAERTVRAAVRTVPSIRFEDFPREIQKSAISVSDAAARLGTALHLHLN